MNYRIPRKQEDLLNECDVETFCSSGPGGQNVNKRETAIRLRHRPTQIVVSCQQERTQYRNKKIALELLRRKLIKHLRHHRPRIPTAPPPEVREKILASKKHNALKKKLRKNPPLE